MGYVMLAFQMGLCETHDVYVVVLCKFTYQIFLFIKEILYIYMANGDCRCKLWVIKLWGGGIGRCLVCNSFIASLTAECVLIPDSSKFNICSPCIDFTWLNATYAWPLLNLFAPFMSTTTFSSVSPWHLCIVTAHARVKGNCVLLIWAPFLFSFWYCPLWR